MAMAGANPFAIQKAMGHKDIKTTMIYVDIAKPHIQEQIAKLNKIAIPPPPCVRRANLRFLSGKEITKSRNANSSHLQERRPTPRFPSVEVRVAFLHFVVIDVS